MESFRSYKTLEAFKYYDSGFVQSLHCKKMIYEKSIILSRVISYIKLSRLDYTITNVFGETFSKDE